MHEGIPTHMLDRLIKKFKKNKSPENFYNILGEENGVYELVKNFYNTMETDPRAKECLLTHVLVDGIVPDEVKKKLFMFLCGWLGGPNLFIENYGHPRMRARHLHIQIGQKEKAQWLYCMQNAIKIHSVKMSRAQKKTLLNSFTALALRIQNSN